MFVRLDARKQIVEATDTRQSEDYIEVAGTVAEVLPKGVFGFNGRVQTANYKLIDGAVIERTDEEKAKDPYSDPPETDTDVLNALLGV